MVQYPSCIETETESRCVTVQCKTPLWYPTMWLCRTLKPIEAKPNKLQVLLVYSDTKTSRWLVYTSSTYSLFEFAMIWLRGSLYSGKLD